MRVERQVQREAYERGEGLGIRRVRKMIKGEKVAGDIGIIQEGE